MTETQFDKLKIGDRITVDFNFSNIHIKGNGVVIKKYPTADNWMDLEAIVEESDGSTRQGPLPMESCEIIPVVINANSENCLTQIINVLKQYGRI
jgi:hypothetical protein